MSYTNKTHNYDLPQWLGNDKPTWLTDMNGAFSAIDTAIKGASDSGSSAEAIANNALSTAQSAQETANTAVTTANEAMTNAGEATSVANNANQQAGTALTTAQTALTNSENALLLGSWKKITLDYADINVISTITKSETVNAWVGATLFYNEKMQLMQISASIPVTETTNLSLSTYVDINGVRYFPVWQLPFSCENVLTLRSCTWETFRITISSSTYNFPRVSNIAIIPYNGNAWIATINKTSAATDDYPDQLAVLTMPTVWINTNSLGTITLNGWQPV